MTNSAIGGHVVLPVTVQAGPHLERLSGLGLDFGHGGYVAVADRAGLAHRHGKLAGTASSQGNIYSAGLTLGQKSDVGLVDEPDVIRQPVDPLPINGIAIGESVGEEEKERLLLGETPRYLFPFSRKILSDITQDASFPPLVINPINFDEYFERHKKGTLTATLAAQSEAAQSGAAQSGAAQPSSPEPGREAELAAPDTG